MVLLQYRPQCPIIHLLTDTVILTHYKATGRMDDLGNPVKSASVIVLRAAMQAVSGMISTNGAQYSARCYIAPSSEVSEDDTIEHNGKLYWVNSVQYHRTPRYNALEYIALDLRETLERVERVGDWRYNGHIRSKNRRTSNGG